MSNNMIIGAVVVYTICGLIGYRLYFNIKNSMAIRNYFEDNFKNPKE